jgi:hypothetical protein
LVTLLHTLDGGYQDAIARVQGPCAGKTTELVALRRTLYDSAMVQAARLQADAAEVQRSSLLQARAAAALWRITDFITRPLATAGGTSKSVSEARLAMPMPAGGGCATNSTLWPCSRPQPRWSNSAVPCSKWLNTRHRP